MKVLSFFGGDPLKCMGVWVKVRLTLARVTLTLTLFHNYEM
jgi:hypothetical protein